MRTPVLTVTGKRSARREEKTLQPCFLPLRMLRVSHKCKHLATGLETLRTSQSNWNPPSLAKLLASYEHNGAIPSPSDNHRFPTLLRIVELLYGGVNRVHVDMDDFSHDPQTKILFRASDAVNVRRTDRQRSLLYILEDA